MFVAVMWCSLHGRRTSSRTLWPFHRTRVCLVVGHAWHTPSLCTTNSRRVRFKGGGRFHFKTDNKMGHFYGNFPYKRALFGRVWSAYRHLGMWFGLSRGPTRSLTPVISPNAFRLCVRTLGICRFSAYCRSYEFAVCGPVCCSSPFHDYVAPSCSTKRQHHRLLPSCRRCVMRDL